MGLRIYTMRRTLLHRRIFMFGLNRSYDGNFVRSIFRYKQSVENSQ